MLVMNHLIGDLLITMMQMMLMMLMMKLMIQKVKVKKMTIVKELKKVMMEPMIRKMSTSLSGT